MSDGGIDDTQLRELSVDLSSAPARVYPQIRAVIQRGALAIKTQMREEMKSSASFGQIAPSITYDTRELGKSIIAEIGPVPGKSGGALENIAYFGSSRGGGGTVPDPIGALDTEAPNVERYLADIMDGLL